MYNKYDNYIFDLYGTLVDIHTDEESLELWTNMAGKLKDEYGANYEAKELRATYLKLCKEEEKDLQSKNHSEYPEIKIERVWAKLISNKINEKVAPASLEDLCIYFREESRDKFTLYKDTMNLINGLRKDGKKVFLLSNAQRFFTEKELDETGLTSCFDDIFISSDKGVKKPQKEFLEELIKSNNLEPSRCVMIGNETFSDGGVAEKNGVDAIIVKDGDFSDIG